MSKSYLAQHFKNVRNSLLAKAEEVGIAQHGTLKGSARELIISEFLASSLPRGFDFSTGEIVAPSAKKSGQLDIMIIPYSAPKIALGGDFTVGLLHAVAGVIEVKSTLTTAGLDSSSELLNALKTTHSVKSLEIDPPLDPWPWSAGKGQSGGVTLEHIPVSIVAFSGPTIETLRAHLHLWYKQGKKMPNTVTCLDRNYTLIKNDGWMFRSLQTVEEEELYITANDRESCLQDLFDYKMKCLQAWAYAQPRTPLSVY